LINSTISCRILSDILPLQIQPTRHRGIGRYTTRALHALLGQAPEGQAHILWGSGHLAQPDPFPDKAPTTWRLYYGDFPLATYQPEQWSKQLGAYGDYWQTQIDRFSPEVLHIHSPFEWNAPLHSRHARVPTVVTVYDLIPLRLQEHYLRHAPNWMQKGYRHVCRLVQDADHIIAISECSRQDIVDLLHIEPERISVAPGGPSEDFSRIPDAKRQGDLRTRFGLREGFVLSTAGFDYRKNLSRILESYSLLEPRLRQEFPLVIVCSLLSEQEALLHSQARDLGISDHLVLTNYLSSDDLVALYHMATVQFFPSLYEGLGLPILDAMLCGLPVITSNTSSLPEVAGDAALLVDPLDVHDMTGALTRMLSDQELRASMRAKGLARVNLFGWGKTAEVLRQVYRQVARPTGPAYVPPFLQRQPPVLNSLAMVSPLPPQLSGVADFSADLLRSLRQHVAVTAFVQSDQLPAIRRHVESPVQGITDLPRMVRAGQIDAVLYQIGNSAMHHFAMPYLSSVPGIAEIHDGILYGLIHSLTLGRGDVAAYRQELSYAHDEKGREHAEDVIAHRASPAFYEMTVNRRVVNAAIGIIVHNGWTRDVVQAHGTNQPIQMINHPVRASESAYNLPSKAVCRSKLGISSDDLVLATFGRLTSNKRLDVVLHTFARLCREVPQSRLLLVGPAEPPSMGLHLSQLIQKLGIGDRVQITGYVAESDFAEYMGASDIGINLRYPHAGETSGTLVRLLNAGIPVITSNLGPFAELPDDCCWKVDVDEWEEDLLLAYLLRVGTDQALRRQMSDNARCYVQAEIPSWDQVAEAYLTFIYEAMLSQMAFVPRGEKQVRARTRSVK
jgi:glycosyltransferase involved in cell wall biosynthesis